MYSWVLSLRTWKLCVFSVTLNWPAPTLSVREGRVPTAFQAHSRPSAFSAAPRTSSVEPTHFLQPVSQGWVLRGPPRVAHDEHQCKYRLRGWCFVSVGFFSVCVFNKSVSLSPQRGISGSNIISIKNMYILHLSRYWQITFPKAL